MSCTVEGLSRVTTDSDEGIPFHMKLKDEGERERNEEGGFVNEKKRGGDASDTVARHDSKPCPSVFDDLLSSLKSSRKA